MTEQGGNAGPEHESLTESDERDLRLLSLGHYTLAALNAVVGAVQFLVFRGFYSVFHRLQLKSGDPEQMERTQEALAIQTELMEWMFALGGVFVVAQVVSMTLVAYWLGSRNHYRLCFGLSILNCLFFPFGTVAAVFAIIVLRRQAVEAAFDLRTSAQ